MLLAVKDSEAIVDVVVDLCELRAELPIDGDGGVDGEPGGEPALPHRNLTRDAESIAAAPR
jgi:hypothetical protein